MASERKEGSVRCVCAAEVVSEAEKMASERKEDVLNEVSSLREEYRAIRQEKQGKEIQREHFVIDRQAYEAQAEKVEEQVTNVENTLLKEIEDYKKTNAALINTYFNNLTVRKQVVKRLLKQVDIEQMDVPKRKTEQAKETIFDDCSFIENYSITKQNVRREKICSKVKLLSRIDNELAAEPAYLAQERKCNADCLYSGETVKMVDFSALVSSSSEAEQEEKITVSHEDIFHQFKMSVSSVKGSRAEEVLDETLKEGEGEGRQPICLQEPSYMIHFEDLVKEHQGYLMSSHKLTSMKRMQEQIYCLEELVLKLVLSFNDAQSQFLTSREDRVEQVKERCDQLREKCEELEVDVEAHVPMIPEPSVECVEVFEYSSVWEQPDTLTMLQDAEVGVQRYLSEEALKALKVKEEEQRKKEAKQKLDFSYQALVTMMDGVLDEKSSKKTSRRQKVASMSKEQQTTELCPVDEEGDAKAMKRLALEVKKIGGEIRDIYDQDDKEFQQLLAQRLTTSEKLVVLELEIATLEQKLLLADRFQQDMDHLLVSLSDQYRCLSRLEKAARSVSAGVGSGKATASELMSALSEVDSRFKSLMGCYNILNVGFVKVIRAVYRTKPEEEAINFDDERETISLFARKLQEVPDLEELVTDELITDLAKLKMERQAIEEKSTAVSVKISELQDKLKTVKRQKTEHTVTFNSLCRDYLGIYSALNTLVVDYDVTVQLLQGQLYLEDGKKGSQLILPCSTIKQENKTICLLGDRMLNALKQVMDTKQVVGMLSWENEFLNYSKVDLLEHYTDLHMVKVTKSLQQKIKQLYSCKQKNDASKENLESRSSEAELDLSLGVNVSEKLECLNKFVANKMYKLEQDAKEYRYKIVRLQKENHSLQAETQVFKARIATSEALWSDFQATSARQQKMSEARIRKILAKQEEEISRLQSLKNIQREREEEEKNKEFENLFRIQA